MNPASNQSKAGHWGLIVAVSLLVLGFLVYVFGELQAPDALKSSIYTYYQTSYYEKISAGQIPWIHFPFEYPPLAAYALVFPAFVKGLSIFTVSVLRGLTCLVCSLVALRAIHRASHLPLSVRSSVACVIGGLACAVPGFYFGLFDWMLCLVNIWMAILLTRPRDDEPLPTGFWPLVLAGTSVKLMPVLAAPFLYPFAKLQERSTFWKTVVATILIHVPFLVFGFHEFRGFIAYHRHRSIDNFSIYACILEWMERLGLTTTKRVWNFGALELQGRAAELMAKISLPLYLLVYIGLWVVAHRLRDRRSSFAIYSLAILLYPSISKVCQGNYVIWAVTAIATLWMCGYTDPRFLRISITTILAFFAIAYYQDNFFAANTQTVVPWFTIAVNSLRHVLTIGYAIFALRMIRSTPNLKMQTQV